MGLIAVEERSIKLTTKGVPDHRFVVGIDAKAISQSQWQKILDYFNPSFFLVEKLREYLANASTIGLGQEGNWENGNRRIYIERWGELEQKLSRNAVKKIGCSFPAMQAWKWNQKQSSKIRTSYYEVYPWLTTEECCRRFLAQSEWHLKEATLQEMNILFKQHVVKTSINSKQNLQLWSVKDDISGKEDSKRNSMDLNLIDFQIPLISTKMLINKLDQQGLTLNDDNYMWLKGAQDGTILSHISAGIDRSGDPFVTFYAI